MLGAKIGEEHGKVTSRRVLPGDGKYVKMEVSFETQCTLYGVNGMNVGTYEMWERIPGQLYASGQGVVMTQDGDGAIWNGHGVGTFTPEGKMHFAAAISFQTDSEKLKKLNSVMTMVEHISDMEGKADSMLYEWSA